MPQQHVDAEVPSVLKEIASIKNFHLYETHFGTYKITYNGKAVANPSTEEDAWTRIRLLAGTVHAQPQCWDNCRIHNCMDCERYY